MSKSTSTYWNPLAPEQAHRWRWLEGLEGQVQELVLSEDPATGEITRLTRFLPGADTAAFGSKAHDFPEELLIVSGRLFDGAFGLWLESGHDASRSPGGGAWPLPHRGGLPGAGCVLSPASRRQAVLTGAGAGRGAPGAVTGRWPQSP